MALLQFGFAVYNIAGHLYDLLMAGVGGISVIIGANSTSLVVLIAVLMTEIPPASAAKGDYRLPLLCCSVAPGG